MTEPFELIGVVHLVRPAGMTAHHLEGLRAGISAATSHTLLHHAFGPQLRHPSAEELPPDDFSAFGRAVAGVLKDATMSGRLRERARTRIAQGFSWERLAVRLEETYATAIAALSPRP